MAILKRQDKTEGPCLKAAIGIDVLSVLHNMLRRRGRRALLCVAALSGGLGAGPQLLEEDDPLLQPLAGRAVRGIAGVFPRVLAGRTHTVIAPFCLHFIKASVIVCVALRCIVVAEPLDTERGQSGWVGTGDNAVGSYRFGKDRISSDGVMQRPT